MDESWRCTMGAVLPRQRSSDGQHASGHHSLAPDDFRDVFGGPPRTVLSSFYGDAASAADHHAATAGHGGRYPHYSYGGRGRPASAAVPTEEGFFDDIFGARARQVRSRSSRSKSTKSSSVVSSDEFGSGRSAFQSAATRGDAALSSFASKLRPIAIPSRRYDSSPPSSVSTRAEYQSSFTCSTAAYPACRYYYGNGGDWTNHSGGSSAASSAVSYSGAAAAESSSSRHHRGGSSGFCCFTSNPETSSREPSFRRTQRRGMARSPAADYAAADTSTECSGAADDYGYYYSPSSAASSSLFGNPPRPRPHRLEEAVMQEAMMMEVRERAPLLMDDDGDIDSVGAAAVDEAIAWAKEKFWSQA